MSLGTLKTAGVDAQTTPLFLVVFGACVTAMGCWHKWPELNTLGAGIAGAGIQAIVTQFKTPAVPPGGSATESTTISSTSEISGVSSTAKVP